MKSLWIMISVILCVIPIPARAQPDSLEAMNRVDRLLRLRYRPGARSNVRVTGRSLANVDQRCDGGAGYLCHGGDPDRGYCPKDVLCHPAEGSLIEGLWEEAARNPGSAYLMGQATYALTKFGLLVDAQELVNQCRADSWWCKALQGYVLQHFGRGGEAESLLREALETAPPEVRCAWGDALWLLGEWDQRRVGVDFVPESREETLDWSCEKRLAVSDTIWWMADPLFSDTENDRWTEHMTRAMSAGFAGEIREAVRGTRLPSRDYEANWAMHIRRGSWDSFEVPLGRGPLEFWTSEEKALYHFVPEVAPGDLATATWQLSSDVKKEGFTPNLGPFYSISVQYARFLASGSLLVAVAGDLLDTPLRRASSADAYLVLSEGPGGAPFRFEEPITDEKPAFLEVVQPRDYVVSFEVITRLGIGWDRQRMPALRPTGPEISDLLFFDTTRLPAAESVEEAASAMLASTHLEEDVQVGIFFEVYGVPDAQVEIEILVEDGSERPAGTRALLAPDGVETATGGLGWTLQVDGGRVSRSFSLDTAVLDGGEYTLKARVRWPGQVWLERSRRFTVRD